MRHYSSPGEWQGRTSINRLCIQRRDHWQSCERQELELSRYSVGTGDRRRKSCKVRSYIPHAPTYSCFHFLWGRREKRTAVTRLSDHSGTQFGHCAQLNSGSLPTSSRCQKPTNFCLTPRSHLPNSLVSRRPQRYVSLGQET